MTRRIVVVLLLLWVSGGRAYAEDAKAKLAHAHSKQGKAYFEAGDYDRAVAEYQAAYDIDGKPTRLYNIAVSYEKKGDASQAVAYYQKYLAADPDGEVADYAREAIAALEKQLDDAAQKQREAEAEDARRKAAADDEEKRAAAKATAEDHAKQAQADLEVKNFAHAADEWLAADAALPDAEYVFAAAEAYRAAGEKDQALEQYRRYLAAAHDGPHAGDARRQIAILTTPPKSIESPALGTAVTRKVPRHRVRPTIVDDRPPPKPAPKWIWPTLAAVSLLTGIAIDVLPASAHDGRFEVTDAIPLGLYGGALIFTGVWVF
jgi:hypothetical protein